MCESYSGNNLKEIMPARLFQILPKGRTVKNKHSNRSDDRMLIVDGQQHNNLILFKKNRLLSANNMPFMMLAI